MQETVKAYENQTLDNIQLEEVRLLLRADPKLWRAHGDVAAWSRDKALEHIPKRTLQYESVIAGIEHMRNDFLEEGDSDLERMIVEQIITCWLQLGMTGTRLNSNPTTKEEWDERRRTYREYNQDQIRFASSVSLLNRTRKSIAETGIKRYGPLTYGAMNAKKSELDDVLLVEEMIEELEQVAKAKPKSKPKQVQQHFIAREIQPTPDEPKSLVEEPKAADETQALEPEPDNEPPKERDFSNYPHWPGVAIGSKHHLWLCRTYEDEMKNRAASRAKEAAEREQRGY